VLGLHCNSVTLQCPRAEWLTRADCADSGWSGSPPDT